MKHLKENLNIALAHEWITNVAGAERVLLQMHELFPKAPIYTAVFDEKKAKPFAGLNIITSFLQRIPFMKSRREALVPFVPFAFEQFDFSKYDLVISSATVGAKGIITKPETIHICYCHTPTRYLWETEVDPRAKVGRLSWLRRKVIHSMRIWDRLAAERPDFYIANSQYVANRIKKYYRRDAKVIYPGVDTQKFQPTAKENIKDYFLYVSRLVSYKRPDLIIEAFNQTGQKLKIIGAGPEKDKLQKMAKNNIEFLGHISDSDMKKYYAEAKAFVFVAEEDFGIVPVEAMAAGRPVIAYSVGGQAESVIDGKTGVLFHDQTVGCLVKTLLEFDHTKYDVSAIRAQAEKFSIQNFKKNLMEEIERVVELRS